MKHSSLNTFFTRQSPEEYPFYAGKEGYMCRLPLLLKEIEKENPDTVSLQEILNDTEALTLVSDWAALNNYIFRSVPYRSREKACCLGFLVKATEGIVVINCNFEGDERTDVIQGNLVKQGCETRLYVNIHVDPSDTKRTHLSTISLREAIQFMLAQSSAKVDSVVVSGDMNAFCDSKKLPRDQYISNLRSSIAETVNQHYKLDQVFNAVEVFENASAEENVARYSFFPAPTDCLVSNLETAVIDLRESESKTFISPDKLAKLEGHLLLLNNIFCQPGNDPRRLDLIFLCAAHIQIQNRKVRILSVETIGLSIAPKRNIFTEMLYSHNHKGPRPDSPHHANETPLSDHSMCSMVFSTRQID